MATAIPQIRQQCYISIIGIIHLVHACVYQGVRNVSFSENVNVRNK